MPTLSKAQLIETESPWGAAFDRMYLELCRDRVPILTALGFYAEHDLPQPEENSDAIPTQGEEEELRQIASALTFAGAASEVMPPVCSSPPFSKFRKIPTCSSRAGCRHLSSGQSRAAISAATRSPERIGETYGETRLRLFREKSNNRQH